MPGFEKGDIPTGEMVAPDIQKKFSIELPDDSGDAKYQVELPDDSGEVLSKELEDIKKQDDIIDKVMCGQLQLNDTKQKGNFGEMLCDQVCRRIGYERISNDIVTSLEDKGHEGIDGVYYNPDGHPPYIIADAKYNTAQLADTKDGKQMSMAWINARLDAAVGKERADDIRTAMLDDDVGCYVMRIGVGDNVNAPVIFERLDDNGNIISRGDDLNVS